MRAQAVRDRLGTLTPPAIRAPAFAVLDRLQHFPDPVVQLTAMTVALCAMAEAAGIPFGDLVQVGRNTLADSEGPFTEHIQAIRAYAKGEWLQDHHDH